MPNSASEALFTIIFVIVAVMVSAAVTAVALTAILGNPAWSGTVFYNTIKDFQTIVGGGLGGGLALMGIWLGLHGNRRRDERLQREEARGLAIALFGELQAALVTCSAFVAQINAASAKRYNQHWLHKEIMGTNFGPRVRTRVFEANAAKIGLLGEPLASEIIVTFDQLFDYARMADKQEIMSQARLLKAQSECASQLETDFILALQETIKILQAYIAGGLPAAAKVALSIMPDREKRRVRLGQELGIDPATSD